MEAPRRISTNTLPGQAARGDRASTSADRAYQTLTVAAILIVLGSLWVF